MGDDTYVRGKSKTQLLADLYGTARPNSPVHEQLKLGVIVRCTEDIEARASELASAIDEASSLLGQKADRLTAAINEAANVTTQSMEKAGRSSDRLTSMLIVLNVILAAATVVGAVATVAALFR